ncbi:GNAT family N-acetyltransferase [uncultured Deinococcus sp.]|uniref:GNAT family N-acetyltransferase n=1 Tax=uncultured Deinococcus sp. TaxID=158789 RepID=UPI00258D480F|nr:GNAT family N-acetyltransferase [uncultured Deinococcus sp.]
MGLRAFTPADAPAWAALTNAALVQQTTPERLLDDDARHDPAEPSRRWIWESGNRLAGVARLHRFPFDPPKFLHAQVVVASAQRGRGVGTALWEAVRAAAGGVPLAAGVADDDPASLAWAQGRGFARHRHRFASVLDLTTFDEAPFAPDLERAAAQGVTLTDLGGADAGRLARYLDFFAERLTETPDLAGHPRWSAAQVRASLHLDHDPHPEWLVLATGPDGGWLGTSALVRYGDLAYNALTALTLPARGRGLALPLKLEAIRRARAAGLTRMKTNNLSTNAPMLAVNRRLGFAALPGAFELRRPSGTAPA